VSITTTKASLTNLAGALRPLGITLPDPVIEADRQAEAIDQEISLLRDGHTAPEILASVVDDIVNGRDLSKNRGAVDALVRHSLFHNSGLAPALVARADKLRLDAITAAADDVMAQLRPIVDDAGIAIAEARKRLGPNADLTGTSVPPSDVGRVTAWARAREGLARLPQVITAWHALNRAVHPDAPSTAERVLILCDRLTVEEYEEVTHSNPRDDYLAVRRGSHLRLAGLGEVRARQRRIQDQRAKRQQRHEREQRAYIKQHY